jgi:hypothetical protein
MNFCEPVSAGPIMSCSGVGLVVEIMKELCVSSARSGHRREGRGAALTLLPFVALLIHQVGELHEHFERRRAAGGTGAVDNSEASPSAP